MAHAKTDRTVHLANQWGGAACNNLLAFGTRMRTPGATLQSGERWCGHCQKKLIRVQKGAV